MLIYWSKFQESTEVDSKFSKTGAMKKKKKTGAMSKNKRKPKGGKKKVPRNMTPVQPI